MEIEPSYQKIMEFNHGQSKIEIYEMPGDDETARKNLIALHDTINEIAWDLNKKGVDTSSWFLTPAQIKKMEQDPKYHFI